MERVCNTCGTVAEPERFTPGSFLIEVVLWLCLLVPGLVYSLWRLSKRHDVCAACGGMELLPLDSPRGQQVARALGGARPREAAPAARPPSPGARRLGVRLGRLVGRLMG